MRVGIDVRLLAYQRAGIPTYIRELVGAIASRLKDSPRDDSLVLLQSRKARAVIPGLDGLPRRTLRTPCHFRWERWALGVELATADLDVLHSPDFIPPARLGRRWARVITVHDLAFLHFPELLTAESRRYYGQIFRGVREAERIIAVSEATRRDLIALTGAPAGRIVVIPEAADRRFRPADPVWAWRTVAERFGIDAPFFFFVGTIEPRKNLPRLIEAFGRLRRAADGAGPPLLVIAGRRGWLSDDVDEVARPLGDAIRFIGPAHDDELLALYNASLALAYPSLYEGFGLPVLEAMACGRPVLTANAGSLPEVAGDAALVVDPRDVDGIARGLTRLWCEPALREELARRGLARAGRFSWESVAAATWEVYRQAHACES